MEPKGANIRIRAVELPDLDGLADVLVPEVSRAQIRRRYDESLLGYREMFVAELDGQIAGTVSTGGWGFQRPNSLRMFALDVGRAFRNHGVGTELIRAVESTAIGLNLNKSTWRCPLTMSMRYGSMNASVTGAFRNP